LAVVKRLGLVSFARVQAAVLLVFGLVMAVFQAIYYAFASKGDPALFQGIAASDVYWGILYIPLVWGLFGFVSAAFFAWLYNRFASYFGGIELEIENDAQLKRVRK
jgi:hypothetical protein